MKTKHATPRAHNAMLTPYFDMIARTRHSRGARLAHSIITEAMANHIVSVEYSAEDKTLALYEDLMRAKRARDKEFSRIGLAHEAD